MNGRNSTALAVPKRKAARWDERWVAYPRRNPRRQGPRHRCTWFAGQARGAIKMAGHVYWAASRRDLLVRSDARQLDHPLRFGGHDERAPPILPFGETRLSRPLGSSISLLRA
jgi:hypothetical protein